MLTSKQQVQKRSWRTAAGLFVSLAFVTHATAQRIPSQPGGPAAAVVSLEDSAILRDILKNGTPTTQAEALDRLNAVDPQLALDSLIADFRNPQLGSRLQSLQLLDKSLTIDAQTVTSLLRDALHDDNRTIGDYALAALARRAQSQPAVLTSSDLDGPESQSRQLAKVSLSAAAQDLSALRELLRNGDAVVQSAAFDALATEDPSLAMSELVSEFQDKASLYRLPSLELLVRSSYTDRATLPQFLKQASLDEDPLVRAYAKQVLRQPVL